MGDCEFTLTQQATHVNVTGVELHEALPLFRKEYVVFLGTDFFPHLIEVPLGKPAARHYDDPVPCKTDEL